MGYPVYLATAGTHVLARWDDGTESFNVEGTDQQMSRRANEHYFKRPYGVQPDDIAPGHDLWPLTPREEFAQFLDLRSGYLFCEGRFDEMVVCRKLASEINPKNPRYLRGYQRALYLRQLFHEERLKFYPVESPSSPIGTEGLTLFAPPDGTQANTVEECLAAHERLGARSNAWTNGGQQRV